MPNNCNPEGLPESCIYYYDYDGGDYCHYYDEFDDYVDLDVVKIKHCPHKITFRQVQEMQKKLKEIKDNAVDAQEVKDA